MNESHRNRRRLMLELRVARALLDAADPGDAARRFLRSVCRIDGWCFAALWLVEPERHRLRCKAAWPASTAHPQHDAAREHRLDLLRDAVADLDQVKGSVPAYVAPEDSAPIQSS